MTDIELIALIAKMPHKIKLKVFSSQDFEDRVKDILREAYNKGREEGFDAGLAAEQERHYL